MGDENDCLQNTNNIKFIHGHGNHTVYQDNQQFDLPDGCNVIYVVNLGKLTAINKDSYDDLFYYLRKIDFDLNKMYNMDRVNYDNYNRTDNKCNIFGKEYYKQDTKDFSNRYNNFWDGYKQTLVNHFQNEIKKSSDDKEYKTYCQGELNTIINFGKLEFKLHVGGSGKKMNDMAITFQNIPKDIGKFGMLCYNKDKYDSNDYFDNMFHIISDDQLHLPILLSHIIEKYKKGTYLVFSCREVYDNLDHELEEVARLTESMMMPNRFSTNEINVKCCRKDLTCLGTPEKTPCEHCAKFVCPAHKERNKHPCSTYCLLCDNNSKFSSCLECFLCYSEEITSKYYCHSHIEEHFLYNHLGDLYGADADNKLNLKNLILEIYLIYPKVFNRLLESKNMSLRFKADSIINKLNTKIKEYIKAYYNIKKGTSHVSERDFVDIVKYDISQITGELVNM